MAFDDVARRMKGHAGAGDAPLIADPDRIIADALVAERRSQRLKDLVLGPMLVLGGIIVGLLWLSTLRQGTAAVHVSSGANDASILRSPLMIAFAAFAGGAIFVGTHKILRGLGVLSR